MPTTYKNDSHVQLARYNQQFGCLSSSGFKHFMKNISEDRWMLQFSIDQYQDTINRYGTLVQHSMRKVVDYFYTFSNIVGYLDQGEFWVIADKDINELEVQLRSILPEFMDFTTSRELWKGNTSLVFDKKLTSPLYSEIQNGIIQNKFTNLYQPIFNRDLEVVGSEALVRWQDHKHVGPETFLEAARSDFLLELIEERVWKNLVKASDSGYLHQKYVTINISAERFQDPTLADKLIQDLVDRVDICLIVEITEHLKFDANDVSKDNLLKLKEHGVSVYLDDFGTGYSGLGSLLQLHIDGIKIDKRFVDGLGHSKESQIICRSIIQLAQNMDVSIVAEGVEEKEQLDWLVNEGCELFQGYFFSKPLTAMDLSSMDPALS